jgi:hypothetical protein
LKREKINSFFVLATWRKIYIFKSGKLEVLFREWRLCPAAETPWGGVCGQTGGILTQFARSALPFFSVLARLEKSKFLIFWRHIFTFSAILGNHQTPPTNTGFST